MITCFDKCNHWIKFTQLCQFGLGKPAFIFTIITKKQINKTNKESKLKAVKELTFA